MGVSEIGGQDRKHPVDVVPGLVPSQQCVDGIGVPKVVDPRAACPDSSAKAGAPNTRYEDQLDALDMQSFATFADEKVIAQPPWRAGIPPFTIIPKHRDGRLMDRNDPRFAELRLFDGNNAGIEIYI